MAGKLIVVTFVTTNHWQTLRLRDGGYKSITVIKVFGNMNLAFYEQAIALSLSLATTKLQCNCIIWWDFSWMDSFPFEMSLFFTLMADYDQFWHVSAAFNWLHRAIMSVGPGKSKFWTRHLRFSTWKPPVNRGNEFRSFYPFSPLLLSRFFASNPLKTFMKFYLAFNYS